MSTKVPVRDGKTGSDLFNDMATDKRLLPHLDMPTNVGVTGKNVKVEEQHGTFPYNTQVYEFAQVGEKLPFFQEHRLSLRFDYHQLKITDRIRPARESCARANLTRTNFQNMIKGNGQPNPPKVTYTTAVTWWCCWSRTWCSASTRSAAKCCGNATSTATNSRFPASPVSRCADVEPVPRRSQGQQHSTDLPDGWVQAPRRPPVSLEGVRSSVCTRGDGLIAIDPRDGRDTLDARTSVNSRCW